MKHMPRISARHLLSNLRQIIYRMRFILPERKCCLQLPSTRAYRESVSRGSRSHGDDEVQGKFAR